MIGLPGRGLVVAEIANPYNNYMLNEARAAYNFRGYKKNKNNPQAADLFFKAYLKVF